MNSDSKFTMLLEPGRIGQMELRNRIVYPAIGTDYGSDDGYVTERTKAYYEARARGGAALITVEIAGVQHPIGKALLRQLSISDDKFIPGWSELAQIVHRHGAKIAVQLHHGGRKTRAVHSKEGYPPVGPSPIPMTEGEMPRELTLVDIAEIIECYAKAAERARKAGFDGVELHAGHGYLIAQFLSLSSNRRQDAYGGDLERRQRFLLDVIRAVRSRVGTDFPVWCRLDGMEFEVEDGITRREARETARAIESAGLDAIHVSGYGDAATVNFTTAPLVSQPGKLTPLAHMIKKVVNIPVITVGMISPELGERTLREGKADFIAMGRQLIADPELPNKLASGNVQDVRRCIYCEHCMRTAFRAEALLCAINSAVGREREFTIRPPKRAKKVLVAGGGPAGMEAARVAALRGHHVSLYEKERWLGGLLAYAAILQSDFRDLITYLRAQLKKLHVSVKLGVEVTPALIEKIKPDVVIVALGGGPLPPEISRVDGGRVIRSSEIWQMMSHHFRENGKPSRRKGIKVLDDITKPRERVVVVGGDLVGCILAEFWAKRGRKVTVVESGKRLGWDMAQTLLWKTMRSFEENAVDVFSRVQYGQIDREGMTFATAEGQSTTIKTDAVVLVDRVQPNMTFLKAIEGEVSEVYAVGDCTEKRMIQGAIADADTIALRI